MPNRRGRTGPPRRRVGGSAVKKSLFVVVEGARTETEYITHWASLHRTAVSVEIHPKKGLAPRTMVDVAVKQKRRADQDEKRGRGSSYDEVWCVFDIDEHHALDETCTKAKNNGVRLAASNPCIELWFLLHFHDQTAELDRAAAQSRSAKALGCGKSLAIECRQALSSRHDQAVARAKALSLRHQGNGLSLDANPSSSIWELVESIRTERQ